ncbi:hypothetical protein BJ875DRAFT_138187 [Amylocarpus encephaloides]|uniref:Uncharacterized protein n=1 Tax=Amylocarpus encephaloides TaxID=45428 RepID=A0A9P7YBK5_9HELO|nr:hypothetical protein BJ875DRAFT_138187 [Amylocarpus encephaloides]
MSFLKKPFQKIKDLGGPNDGGVLSKTEGVSGDATPRSLPPYGVTEGSGNESERFTLLNGNSIKRRSAEFIRETRQRRSIDKARAKAETKKRESMARIADEKFLEEGPPMLTKLYRPYSMNMSKRWNHENRILFKDMDFGKAEGKIISFRARIHTLRRMSAKLVFIVFRQQTMTIQGVLSGFKQHEEHGM